MEDSSATTFIKLSSDEILSRISHINVSKTPFRVWNQDKKYFETTVVSFQQVKEGKDFEVTLVCNSSPQIELKGKLYISFVVRNICFFSQVVLKESLSDKFIIAIGDHVYKYEKRRDERLLAFPHHRIYAVFNIEQSKTNLIFMNKASRDHAQLFKDLIRYVDDDQMGKSVGFRVMDISKQGLSFLVNSLERSYFMESELYNLTIDFNGQEFANLTGKIIYDVSYINPRALRVPMFKIGMFFEKEHFGLKQALIDILGEQNDSSEINQEFEIFIKKYNS